MVGAMVIGQFEIQKKTKLWSGKWSIDAETLATCSTHGYSIPTKWEPERTTLKSIPSSKSMIFGFWLAT